VRGGLGAVQAQAHTADTSLFDRLRQHPVNQRAVRGQRHDQPTISGVAGDPQDVRAKQRLAARQDQDGAGEAENVVNHGEGFVCR